MPYEAVVFDMDGVIFDSETAVMAIWLELARRDGIPHMDRSLSACIGTTTARSREIMLQEYGPDFPYDALALEASQMYHARFDGGRLPLKPGVWELLEYLRGQGKRIALASSTRRETVTNQLRDAQLLPFFDAVICGDMVTRSKPAPDIYLTACEALGVAPTAAFAIEDSYNGIRSAHAGSLRPLMVPDLLPATEEMHQKAETVLPSLLAVKDYIAALEAE